MRLDLRLVNAPWEDPGILVDVEGQGSAWLLDCGMLLPLKPRDLLRIDHVFVTHTHIDHFIGFDLLLRLHLGGGATVNVLGPPGIADHVAGKLAGYVWNLVEDSRLVVRACTLGPGWLQWTTFPCRERFARHDEEPVGHGGGLDLPAGCRLRYAGMEHGVDCLAYVLEEPEVHSVDVSALKSVGAPPGPWVARLKEKAASGDRTGSLQVGDRDMPVAELLDLLVRSRPGRRFAYVTDTAFNKKSVAALRGIAQGVDELWCEAAYLHAEGAKARDHLHMTARQAGRLAAELGAGRLHLFHMSRRYEHDPGLHLAEAREVFANVAEAPRYL